MDNLSPLFAAIRRKSSLSSRHQPVELYAAAAEAQSKNLTSRTVEVGRAAS
jgi:hypothetical protein